MRLFVFIFSIYIMALSLKPCTDSVISKDGKSPSAISDTHDHSEDEEDSCSPLCICSCCGTTCIIITASTFLSKELNLIEPQTIIPYNSTFNSFYYHSFWQPPKIS